MRAFLVQDGSYIDATLDEIIEGYGSMEVYITALNIQIDSLKGALLTDV